MELVARVRERGNWSLNCMARSVELERGCGIIDEKHGKERVDGRMGY